MSIAGLGATDGRGASVCRRVEAWKERSGGRVIVRRRHRRHVNDRCEADMFVACELVVGSQLTRSSEFRGEGTKMKPRPWS